MDQLCQGTTKVKAGLENLCKNHHCFRSSLLVVRMMACLSLNIHFEWASVLYRLIIDPCAALASSGVFSVILLGNLAASYSIAYAEDEGHTIKDRLVAV